MTLDNIQKWVPIISIKQPSINDNTAYVDRLTAKLKKLFKVTDVIISLNILKKIPILIKKYNYKITCVVFKIGINTLKVLHVTTPEKNKSINGLAIDLGTSKITIRLISLNNGKIIDEKHFTNPQVTVSADVLERVHQNNKKPEYLTNLIINSINRNIKALCSNNNILPHNIYILSVAGNTIMTHFFLGITPKYIPIEPYTPSINTPPIIKSKEIGIKVNSNALTFIFPNVGSYFGGDLISGILYSGLNQKNKKSILLDVGTNAEIVIGNKEWMIACAGAAGPALEKDATGIGQIAKKGVIDTIYVNPKTKEIKFTTIGNIPPKGICGSGLIDLIAHLFVSGLIDIQGNFVPKIAPHLFIQKKGSIQMIIVPPEKAAKKTALTISQENITSLVQSKAAMYTIIESIMDLSGVKKNDLSQFYIAGSFGFNINPKSAITIGMLPEIPIKLYKVIGNSSIGGATILLRNPNSIDNIYSIRNNITYIELNINQNFINKLSAAKFLPHTNLSLFPSYGKQHLT